MTCIVNNVRSDYESVVKFGLSILVSAAVISIAAIVASGQGEVVSRVPVVNKAVKYDVSPPLRDLRPNLSTKAKKAEDDIGEGGPIGVTTHDPDPVLQSWAGAGVFGQQNAIPPIGANFDGMGAATGSTPPDPNGDIGPNHYVQMVNSRFQIFSRTGVSMFGPANINTLFAGFGGPCQTENAGDPVILYDQMANRWLLSQFSDSTAPFFNCIAISTTGDPLGTYYRYAFSAPTFPDYPKYGVWPDGYYLTTRESGGGVLGIYALEREKMIAGDPAARSVRFTVAEASTGPNGLLAADLDGTTLPPDGSPNYLLGTRDNDIGAANDALLFYKFKVDWANTAASALDGPTVISTASFDTIFPCTPSARACIPQPGTTTKLDILSYRQRPTFRLSYRNFGTHESLVTSQSVEAATNMAGMRWWEIRNPGTTPVIHQEGTYAPGVTDGVYRWMGSIAMDRMGNMGLGYSVSNGTDVFPGIRYTGRLATDPLGTMPQGEGVIVNGGGSQTSTGNRWGDYSSMSVDPLDDCTFWYTTEYYATTSTTGYKTRVGSFKFPNCVATTPRSWADFDGDGRTDLSVFRPSEGNWYVDRSTAGFSVQQWGLPNDVLTPGDYDGDGKADYAIFRAESDPSKQDYYVLNSATGTISYAVWGLPGDIPVSGDFDGDSKTDFVVFRPSDGNWYQFKSRRRDISVVQFGTVGDVPMAIDNDGDGVSNLAVYRASNLTWYIARPVGIPAQDFDAVQFGLPTDMPVPADFDGDNKQDIAVFRPSNGVWYVLKSSTGGVEATQYGLSGDIPVPGDYDGDGKDDLAVFRNGTWFLNRSASGATQTGFGVSTDIPVPKKYIP